MLWIVSSLTAAAVSRLSVKIELAQPVADYGRGLVSSACLPKGHSDDLHGEMNGGTVSAHC